MVVCTNNIVIHGIRINTGHKDSSGINTKVVVLVRVLVLVLVMV